MKLSTNAAVAEHSSVADHGHASLPLIIAPSGDRRSATLAARIEREHAQFLDALKTHGAILFRGFAIESPHDFERVALALDQQLGTEYLGTSPRAGLTKHVFSASELPGYYPIPQHCEMTFIREAPRRLFFACLRAPKPGSGETPLADFRQVYADLDPAVRARFIERGIRIVRNYDGPRTPRRFDLWKLKRWDEMFGTTDRALVETKCRAEGFTPSWLEEDRLRLISTQPATRTHPETGDEVWFNHVQVFHLDSAPAEYRRIFELRRDPRIFALWQFSRAMVALKRRTAPTADALALHATYGDGTEIPRADLEHVRDTIWKNMVILPWQAGDIVAIDNRRVAHGRLPYRGPRQIVVAWS